MSDINSASAGRFNPVPMDLTELCRRRAEPDWLWRGYLAAGQVTLLTSQWKMGKTTLMAILLAKLQSGGELAGQAVAPGRAAIVSEEAADMWALRAHRLDFGRQLLYCRPIGHVPSPEEWDQLVDHLAGLHESEQARLVIVDPLVMFLPRHSESHASLMLQALAPLKRLTDRGMAVLLLHHPSKDQKLGGQAPRGTGALCGCVDILVEMHWFTKACDGDRRRRLLAWSRFDSTPRRLAIELNPAGTDYALTEDRDFEINDDERALLDLFADMDDWLTHAQVMELWPPEQPRPSSQSVYRWLDRAAQQGSLTREGTGRRNDPFRYRMAKSESNASTGSSK